MKTPDWVKLICWIVGIIFVAAAGWTAVKLEVAQLRAELCVVSIKVDRIENLLTGDGYGPRGRLPEGGAVGEQEVAEARTADGRGSDLPGSTVKAGYSPIGPALLPARP